MPHEKVLTGIHLRLQTLEAHSLALMILYHMEQEMRRGILRLDFFGIDWAKG
jgi:hypothetical protein